jgi:hypothetical protein
MKLRLIAVILFIGLWTLPAGAEGTTCGFPTMIVADGRITRSSIPAATTFFFAWENLSGRSYSVEVKSAVAAYNIAPGTVTIYNQATGNNCTVPLVTKDTGAFDPQVSAGERRSLKAVSTIHWVKVENAGGTPIDYTISVSETTMFSPRWSTFGGFYTSWGINNTTSGTCSVTLDVRNQANAAVGGSPVTFNVNAGAIVFRDTRASDLNVAANQAGKVTLTHDCPPGAIQVDAFLVNDSAVPFVIVPNKFDAVREANH